MPHPFETGRKPADTLKRTWHAETDHPISVGPTPRTILQVSALRRTQITSVHVQIPGIPAHCRVMVVLAVQARATGLRNLKIGGNPGCVIAFQDFPAAMLGEPIFEKRWKAGPEDGQRDYWSAGSPRPRLYLEPARRVSFKFGGFLPAVRRLIMPWEVGAEIGLHSIPHVEHDWQDPKPSECMGIVVSTSAPALCRAHIGGDAGESWETRPRPPAPARRHIP